MLVGMDHPPHPHPNTHTHTQWKLGPVPYYSHHVQMARDTEGDDIKSKTESWPHDKKMELEWKNVNAETEAISKATY